MWQAITKIRKLDDTQDVWAILIVQSAVFFIKTLTYLAQCLLWNGGVVGADGKPFGHDFISFWAASRLLKAGEIGSLYSLPVFSATLEHLFGQPLSLYWWYPPHFLFLLWPLAFVDSYKAAYLGWSAFTAIALAVAMFWKTDLGRGWRWLVFFTPGLYVCLHTGQNGLLFAALLIGGFRLLKPAPWLAGVLLGLLSFKPQFAVLVPFMLLVLKEYKPLMGMVLTAGALMLASIVAFGLASWQDYFNSLMLYQPQFLLLASAKMISVYAALTTLKMPASIAMTLQTATALAVIVLLCLKLKRMQNAAWQEWLLLAAPCVYLVTPYVFPYDTCLLSFVWLFWLQHQERTQGRLSSPHIFLWIVVWYVPMMYDARVIREGLLSLAPVLFLLLFILSLRRNVPQSMAENQ